MLGDKRGGEANFLNKNQLLKHTTKRSKRLVLKKDIGFSTKMEKKMFRLKSLPLHPETKHVSQETADRIFDILQNNHHEWFEYIDRINDKGGSLHSVDVEDSYIRVIDHIRGNPDFAPVPDTELGVIDLTFELWRRCRVTTGYPKPEIRGKPLAPSPDGPFPEKLAAKPISKETEKLGLTQEEVDRYVDQYYVENKGWCYIQGEAWRRDLVVFQLAPGYEKSIVALSKIYPKGEDDKIRHKKIGKLKKESADRVRISVGYYTIEQLQHLFGISELQMDFKL